MTGVPQYLGQGAVYALFAVFLGYLSNAPAYTHFPPDKALLKLAFVHGGKPKGECRVRTPEELAKLAPNMRKRLDCPRERVPVSVELEMDGKVLYRETLPPTGLSGDGPSRTYRRFAVEPGAHRLVARLRDSPRAEGFDYENEATVEIGKGRSLAVDFKAFKGGFSFE